MELQPEAGVVTNRLHGEIVAGGQELGAAGQLKTFAVPVIDLCRPIRAQAHTRSRGANRVIADLGDAFRVRRDGSAGRGLMSPGAELPEPAAVPPAGKASKSARDRAERKPGSGRVGILSDSTLARAKFLQPSAKSYLSNS